jgi:hypothetical protein
MIEQFLTNLVEVSVNVIPIVVMVAALATFVGWLELAHKERATVKVREKKREDRGNDRT